MPKYEFEYYDDKGARHIFEDLYPYSHDFTIVKSPCGKYDAHRIPSTFNVAEGLTANQKVSGTTKKRVEMGKFMREQRTVRQNNYDPGTKEHDSNELWTGVEGKDGITQMPISTEKKE